MKFIILAALLTVVASQGYPKAQYPTPAYPSPAYKAPAAYPAPAYPSPAYAKSPEYTPMPYNFNWAVKDDPSYNDYAHQETADDKGYVTGSYRTLLPDGRTQIVNYKADDYTGYEADVKYDGEAKEYKPSYKPAAYPSPAYPSPAYPSPAYPSPAYPSPAYPSSAYPTPAYSAPKYPSPAYPSPAYPSRKYPTKY